MLAFGASRHQVACAARERYQELGRRAVELIVWTRPDREGLGRFFFFGFFPVVGGGGEPDMER